MFRKMSQKMNITSTLKLPSGYEIPRLGFGVYKIPNDTTNAAVREALRQGYLHIDTASGYGNQGESAAGVHDSGIDRSKIFFTTKVPRNDKPLGYEHTIELVDQALEETGFTYLDLVLIHWPYGGPQARKDTWRALVDSVQAGKVRSIGVSNYGVHHLKELAAYIKELESERGVGKGGVISVGQWELHPWCTRDDIVGWCRDRGIVPEASTSIARGTKDEDPEAKRLAAKYRKSVAQILLRWSLQRGFVPLVKSAKSERIKENADLYDFELTEEEMKGLEGGKYEPVAWDPAVEPLEK